MNTLLAVILTAIIVGTLVWKIAQPDGLVWQMTKRSERWRIADTFLLGAEMSKTPEKGMFLFNSFTHIFFGHEDDLSTYCNDQRKRFHAIRDKVYLAYSQKRALEGETYFTSGNYLESYKAFRDAFSYDIERKNEEAYSRAKMRAEAMMEFNHGQELLKNGDKVASEQQNAYAEELAAKAGYDISKNTWISPAI